MNWQTILLGTLFGFSFPWFIFLHITIVVFFAFRLIWIKRRVSVAIAWALVVGLLPFIGLILYLMIGQKPVGVKLTKKIIAIQHHHTHLMSVMQKRYSACYHSVSPAFQALSILAASENGSPVTDGNSIELHTDSEIIFEKFIREIHSAKKTLYLEFYIWELGGLANQIAESLIQAAKRGVKCQVLLDSIGSRQWLNSSWRLKFQESGILVIEALPIHFFNLPFQRADLRLHRKIFIIDNEVCWTGSMNLVDPSTFKQELHIGKWVDAMVRLKGPIVTLFEATFLVDWHLNNPEFTFPTKEISKVSRQTENVLAQEFSSGPVYRDETLYQLLLSAIIDARETLTIATPYFVPDDNLVQSLIAAAHRGVKVTLLLPHLNDSILVKYCSQSFYSGLLTAGIHIAEFYGGLLHTKFLLIDKRVAIFGSINFDLRSLRLNFETCLLAYDVKFCSSLDDVAQKYLTESQFIDPRKWEKRSRWKQLLENCAYLMSPLL